VEEEELGCQESEEEKNCFRVETKKEPSSDEIRIATELWNDTKCHHTMFFLDFQMGEMMRPKRIEKCLV